MLRNILRAVASFFPISVNQRRIYMRKSKHRIMLSSLALILFFISGPVFGQTGMVQGTVKDLNGAPLAGASVTVEGNQLGTLTSPAGYYSLTLVTGSYTIVVSFVGQTTQRATIFVTSGATLQQDFTLTPAADLAGVLVVGSRSKTPRSNISTPAPVDLIPVSQVINEIGQVDVNQILNFIAPSFQSARQTISDGTDHVDPAQLRGLGSDQVLVLINGKRRHQSALVNVNGTVNRGQVGTDMSAIPATAIERIEILRDGAAAQYGSDAIAGVINIVLKKNTGLLEASVSGGQNMTNYPKNYALYKINGKADDPNVKVNDGGTVQASVGYGFPIGMGHLNITGEYINRDRTNRVGTYTGAVYPNVNGVNRDDSIMQARGLTRDNFDMRVGNSAMVSKAAFLNFTYPGKSEGQFYFFGGVSKKDGEATGVFRYPSSIPGAATTYAPQALMMYPNGFLPEIHTDILDLSGAIGYRTKFGSWDFDISNTLGMNTFDFGVENSVNYSQFAVPGNKQTEFDAGGLRFWQNTSNLDLSIPVNVLGGLNVATGAEFRIDAFGIKSGEEASYKNYDPASKAAAGAQVFPGFVNTIGDNKTRNAKAVYLDVEQDISKNLLVTGALRFEHYSDFGSTLNYKFSARYSVGDVLNFRGSFSSGFRAPSMQQRFFEKTNTVFVQQGNGNLVPVQAGTFTNESVPADLLGIPALREETSKSYSIGVTAMPVSGLEITVDAYQIDIDNRIILTNNFTGGTDSALNAELAAAGASAANFFTNAIDTRARGLEAVFSYNKTFLRKHALRTTLAMTFIDNQVKKDVNGNPIIHASEILVNSGQLGNYFNREDQSRVEVANPRSKVSLTFNYKYNKFGAMLRFVNFGKVTYLDPTINPDSTHKFPVNAFTGQKETLDQVFSAKMVTDLSLSYQIIPRVGITVGANNLFDVYQDMHTHSGNMSSGRFVYSRRVQQMGFNGSYYFARLRFTIQTGK